MIKPKFICTECTHKSICKYAQEMTKIISAICVVCDYYNESLPIDLSRISCNHLTTKSEGLR